MFEEIPSLGGMPSNPEYTVSFTSSPTFGIRVNRRSSGELVLGKQTIITEQLNHPKITGNTVITREL